MKFLFIYDQYVDNRDYDIIEADSFKNAVLKFFEGFEGKDSIFEKSLKGFDETDIDGIIKLTSQFMINHTIRLIFIIDDPIYKDVKYDRS